MLVDLDDALLGAGALARVAEEFDRGADLPVGGMMRTDKASSYPVDFAHARARVVQADAVMAIGGDAGTLTEIGLAWIYRRLIVALRVEGWSGELANRRIDERIRPAEIVDDRAFRSRTASPGSRTRIARSPPS